jgi:microcystin-dependent protein
MKLNSWAMGAGLAACMVAPQAGGSPVDIDALKQHVLDACPVLWEDVRSEIDTDAMPGTIWNGDNADKESFKTFISTVMGAGAPSTEELESMATDPSTVAGECATQRIALLDGLLTQMPDDVKGAMRAVMDQVGLAADAAEGGGWLIGDLRITGLPGPSPGWLFLTGQTIGGPGSNADLTGEILEELFELARTWAPNAGNEDWSAGDTVVLPDLRGRTLVAMGGVPANVLTHPAAGQPGGTFGEELHQLTVDALPAHTHDMDAAGNHDHDYTYRGHESGVASGSGASAWKSNQSKDTGNDGAHTHNLNETGENQPYNVVQPGVAFNIEMKFARGTDGDLAGSEPTGPQIACDATPAKDICEGGGHELTNIVAAIPDGVPDGTEIRMSVSLNGGSVPNGAATNPLVVPTTADESDFGDFNVCFDSHVVPEDSTLTVVFEFVDGTVSNQTCTLNFNFNPST